MFNSLNSTFNSLSQGNFSEITIYMKPNDYAEMKLLGTIGRLVILIRIITIYSHTFFSSQLDQLTRKINSLLSTQRYCRYLNYNNHL